MAKRYYEGAEERKDGGLLNNDMSAVALMPQSVKYHAWPSSQKYSDGELSASMDTITGVNAQMASDASGLIKRRSKNKY